MGIASLINNQAKNKPPEAQLVDTVYTQIRLTNPPSTSTRANVKPSKIGCDRQMYYILTRAVADKVSSTEPKMTLIQHVGSFLHEQIQGALSTLKSGPVVWLDPNTVLEMAKKKGLNTTIAKSSHRDVGAYELHLYNADWDLSFQCDGFIMIDHKIYILEIKSEDYFKNIKRIYAEDQHIEQASCYSLALGFDDVIFLYVDRNYMTIKPYYVHVEDADREVIREKILRVKEAVASGNLPDKEKCKSCQYCDYRGLCKSDLNSIVLGAELTPEEEAKVLAEAGLIPEEQMVKLFGISAVTDVEVHALSAEPEKELSDDNTGN